MFLRRIVAYAKTQPDFENDSQPEIIPFHMYLIFILFLQAIFCGLLYMMYQLYYGGSSMYTLYTTANR